MKNYLILTKPGIIFGNAITAVAGFFLASKGVIDLGLLMAMLAGLSLVIASACVFNNYYDRVIDLKMDRTKNRALATGQIDNLTALSYATLLATGGIFILVNYTNYLALNAALIGMFIYVVVYGWAKRRTVYGTHVGSIAGAVPPVVGYTAVSNNFDGAAVLLFLILVFWQMPHFFAIAIYRLKDYKAANIPVMPLKHGLNVTKINMFVYGIGFAVLCIGLTAFGYTGKFYLAVSLVLSLLWLRQIYQGFKASDDQKWARQVFKFSLIVITVLSITIAVDPIITASMYNPSMVVLLHVLSALASLAASTFLYLSPSKLKLKISYILVALTIGSGTVLVLTLHVNMLKTCLTGLGYLAIVSTAIVAARHKLAAATT